MSIENTIGTTNVVRVIFVADPGESNRVTIRATAPLSADHITLTVIDEGAPVQAGSGCSGGGAPGEPTHCEIERPRRPLEEHCGKSCIVFVPGTAWNGLMSIKLGDGDNSFDAGYFTETYSASFEMTVMSGTGNDRITTGGGEDVIDPGAGQDEVHSGEGFDQVETTASPDGPDLYELGPNTLDELSYRKRTEPVYLHGSLAGAVGEGDRLVGGFYLVGGVGSDVLEGGPHELKLEGGPGNDILSSTGPNPSLYGGSGDDVLSTSGELNHLVGEEGDDTYYGSEGIDIILESEDHQDGGSTPETLPSSSSGNDVAYGAGDNDVIQLEGGSDLAWGGPGDDRLHAGTRGDELRGGKGADTLIGGAGFDRLLGGLGNDRLFSGRKRSDVLKDDFPFPPVPNDGPDAVVCGRGRDVAVSNLWDRLRNCEVVHLLRR